MAVPKRKTSKSKRDKRRANHHAPVKNFAACKNCGASIQSHQICRECGFYKGKEIIKID